jgi:uncharacterized membrane protein YqjE
MSMGGSLGRSVPDVLQHIIDNIQDIFRSECQLAKAEIKEEAAEASKPAATLGAGLILAVYAIGLLLLALVYALAMVLALWSAALLVSVSVAVVAILLINRGVTGLRHVNAKSERTIASLKENLPWANNPRA